MRKPSLPSVCPSCSSRLSVKSMACASCGTRIDGQYELPLLALMSQQDQDFIVSFVKHSGSLKKMSAEMKLSYPTVRNFLNELIDRVENLEKSVSHE